MIIEPKIRGFICTTSHPEGLKKTVEKQIQFVKAKGKMNLEAKNVLVIGASMGYGLASRVALAFGANANTLGVIFDRPPVENRPGSAGWYNTAAFEEAATKSGLYAKTINGDAFSADIKAKAIELIKKDLKKIDVVVYSLASPRRTMADGTVYNSVLKTVGATYTNKTIDLKNNTIGEITVPEATDAEISATVKVMGGEDWRDWIDALKAANVLTDNALTLAYSYLGPKLTHPMYMNGTIGKAKEHLYATAENLRGEGLRAYVAVNKALVTQSSAAIPVVPLYISILFKIMKEAGVHEGCIEQMDRLFRTKIGKTDENKLIRMDDLEMAPNIQNKVEKVWDKVCTENLNELADIDGYAEDFRNLFGFSVDGVDYSCAQNELVKIPSIE